MKIIQVVVDKLPESASQCFAAAENWNAHSGFEEVGCRFTTNKACMSVHLFYRQRCPDCPLVEEEREE